MKMNGIDTCSRSTKAAIGSTMRVLRKQVENPAPEELLWLAVIEHAIRDAYSPKAESEKMREDARKWLDSEYFDGIAVALGLHPGWARRKIHEIPRLSNTH